MPLPACNMPGMYRRAIEDALNEDDFPALVRALATGHDPNGLARSGEPLLMHAIRKFRTGGEAMIRTLLERDADPNAQHGDRTALMVAAMECRPSLIKLLTQAGAALDTVDSDGWTALMWAATRHHYHVSDCAQALVSAGARVDTISNTGSDALMLFAEKGHLVAVQCLLQAGADPCRRNSKKLRASQMAVAGHRVYEHHENCAALLREAEARMDMAVDLDVLTPVPVSAGRPRRM